MEPITEVPKINNCSGFLYTDHALKAMISRFIYHTDVEEVVKTGEIIKHYPSDKPYVSYLFLKFVNSRPLHVVVSQNPENNECIIITCYEPDPKMWVDNFKEKI
jgi:hypothetical protein